MGLRRTRKRSFRESRKLVSNEDRKIVMMELSLLRVIDAIEYLRESYKAFANGDKVAAKNYLALSNAMHRRSRRHWTVAHHGVKR